MSAKRNIKASLLGGLLWANACLCQVQYEASERPATRLQSVAENIYEEDSHVDEESWTTRPGDQYPVRLFGDEIRQEEMDGRLQQYTQSARELISWPAEGDIQTNALEKHVDLHSEPVLPLEYKAVASPAQRKGEDSQVDNLDRSEEQPATHSQDPTSKTSDVERMLSREEAVSAPMEKQDDNQHHSKVDGTNGIRPTTHSATDQAAAVERRFQKQQVQEPLKKSEKRPIDLSNAQRSTNAHGSGDQGIDPTATHTIETSEIVVEHLEDKPSSTTDESYYRHEVQEMSKLPHEELLFENPTKSAPETTYNNNMQQRTSPATMQSDAPPDASPTFTVEQLRLLLQSLEEDEGFAKTHIDDATFDKGTNDHPINEEDDRTLLDLFGEAAKEFLTQKVIPETTSECRWDWRSLNCEPVCECEYRPKVGDYHVGRSCRERIEKPEGICRSIDPAFLVRQTTFSQRFGWLIRRSLKGVQRRSRRRLRLAFQQLVFHSTAQLSNLQHNICSDLWQVLYNERGRTCWPISEVPSVSITQRLLCGPVHFPLCDEYDISSATATRYYSG